MNNKRIIANRILSFFLSIISAIMFYSYYMNFYLIGFPDGHKTELGRAYEKIYPIYMVISGLFVFMFLYLGFYMKRKQNHKKIKWVAFLEIVFVILTLVLYQYLYQILKHGQGG